jgi:hypothetical protein
MKCFGRQARLRCKVYRRGSLGGQGELDAALLLPLMIAAVS